MLKMGHSFFGLVVGVCALLTALAHGWRAYYGFGMTYGDWLVPIWLSWLVCLVAFIVAIVAFTRLK